MNLLRDFILRRTYFRPCSNTAHSTTESKLDQASIKAPSWAQTRRTRMIPLLHSFVLGLGQHEGSSPPESASGSQAQANLAARSPRQRGDSAPPNADARASLIDSVAEATLPLSGMEHPEAGPDHCKPSAARAQPRCDNFVSRICSTLSGLTNDGCKVKNVLISLICE
jgi:hypothetical protein